MVQGRKRLVFLVFSSHYNNYTEKALTVISFSLLYKFDTTQFNLAMIELSTDAIYRSFASIYLTFYVQNIKYRKKTLSFSLSWLSLLSPLCSSLVPSKSQRRPRHAIMQSHAWWALPLPSHFSIYIYSIHNIYLPLLVLLLVDTALCHHDFNYMYIRTLPINSICICIFPRSLNSMYVAYTLISITLHSYPLVLVDSVYLSLSLSLSHLRSLYWFAQCDIDTPQSLTNSLS